MTDLIAILVILCMNTGSSNEVENLYRQIMIAGMKLNFLKGAASLGVEGTMNGKYVG